ncbi:hypothetical protein GCM10010485_53190 [Streptosporangium carneum]
MTGAVHGHRTVSQQVASVHEKRAAIHATPPFLRGPAFPAQTSLKEPLRDQNRRPFLRVIKRLIVRG